MAADHQDQHRAAGQQDVLDFVERLLRRVEVVDQVQLVDGAVEGHLVADGDAGPVLGAHRELGGCPELVLAGFLHGLPQLGRDDADGELVRCPGFHPAVAGLGLLRHRLKDVAALDHGSAALDGVQRVVDERDDAGLVGDLGAVERVLDLLDVVPGLRFRLGQPFLEQVVGDLVRQVGAHHGERADGQQQRGEDRPELQRPAPPPLQRAQQVPDAGQEPDQPGPDQPGDPEPHDPGAAQPDAGPERQPGQSRRPWRRCAPEATVRRARRCVACSAGGLPGPASLSELCGRWTVQEPAL